jgi:hypothetical protein
MEKWYGYSTFKQIIIHEIQIETDRQIHYQAVPGNLCICHNVDHSISVVFDINEKIDKFLQPNVPLKDIILDYYLNFIPYFANLFSPLFTFIAVIFLRRSWQTIQK